jgi:hypothetical protein
MAYIPTQRTVTVHVAQVSGASANVWWFNPRTGLATAAGVYPTAGPQTFMPPDQNDWVLVLDDASLNLPAPGN